MSIEPRTGALPEGRAGWLHPASFGAGAFFTLAGIVFLLERLDIIQLSAGLLWPLLLIGLGLAVVAEEVVARLLGGRG